jgi:hypothetical protein
MKEIIEEENLAEDSLDNTIFHLEESIREKEALIKRTMEKLEDAKRRIELSQE